MPSSLIFTGLVVLWLLILVPAVARHQQEVARPSGASLAGRVLTRPRRRSDGHPSEEGDSVDDDGSRNVGTGTVSVPAARRDEAARSDGARPDAAPPDQRSGEEREEPGAGTAAVDGDASGWERPTPRYRPGRGGYDAEADAVATRRRYARRQRIVLALLILALLTGVAAAAALRVLWWAHAAVDVVLVGYLVYLRRQVREEARIRERRGARMAGTRRPAAADDRELDPWARRGRDLTRRSTETDEAEAAEADGGDDDDGAAALDELGDELPEDGDTTRVRGVGEPVGLLPARRRGADDDTADPPGALPPLRPTPTPPLPEGTSVVEMDDDELDLHDLGPVARGSHRRAVGE